jgi:DNA polymerase III subunit delta'
MPAEASEEEIGDRPGVPRPRETPTLIGHDAAEAAFAEGIAGGRLHHAWLIGGPAGIGKATLAYRVARRLLAYPRGDGPAGLAVPGNHPVHGQVAGLSHPNLVALRRHRAPGAKALPTKISVDMVRKALDLFASTATDSGWRVCVLDSAEDLNANAANALLKVLEEPPPRALFLILAHQPGRLLPTIRSRCRAMVLRPLPDGEVAQAIRALPPPFPQPDEEALARAVGLAEGSVGRALGLVDSVTAGLVAEVETLLSRGATPDWGRVLKLAETLNGRDGEERFAAAGDAVLRFVSAELDRRQGEPVHRLAALVEVCEKFARSAREAATYNLDRRPVVLSLFADLSRAG